MNAPQAGCADNDQKQPAVSTLFFVLESSGLTDVNQSFW
jgi:hypothetical protein